MAGVRSRESMQKLISPRCFSGRGLTCIVNASGKVIISPTELAPFLQLEDIFAEESGDQDTIRAIKQMQKNMENRQNGAFAFTAVDGTKLILTYYQLDSYDWVLFTLIPADLISQQTDTYISQTFLIIAAIILLFFTILLLIFRINREHLRKMKQAAFIDRLTGAPNNAALQIHCAKLLSQSPPNTYAIVLLDLKGFKLINEYFGSAAGNAALCHIMRVLTRHVSGEERAAHADSDHFFLCLRENDPREIQLRLERIVEEINAFNESSEEPYYLTIQQGVYIVGEPSLEIMVIQDRARTACRASTQEGRCVFYDTALTERLQKELELNNLFEQSLENGDFKLYLQPKVQPSGGKVNSAEALVRWQHPQRGMIYPSDFIPLFEKNGRICQLDLFVFEEVCKLLLHWMDGGKEPLPISVNLSRYHFQRQNCLDQFHEIASRYCIPRGLIEMELTESIFFDDQGIELVKMQVHKMHELGFRCSLDDFGAGYSSGAAQGIRCGCDQAGPEIFSGY